MNNIKQELQTLRDDTMTKDVNTEAILKISQELEEIIEEGYSLEEVDEERKDN